MPRKGVKTAYVTYDCWKIPPYFLKYLSTFMSISLVNRLLGGIMMQSIVWENI